MQGHRRFQQISVIGGIGLFILLAQLLLTTASGCEGQKEEGLVSFVEDQYVGSQKCESCHQQAYSDWKQSDHHKALAFANDTTVLGDFADAEYKADGIQSRFFRKGTKFYIETENEEGENETYEVVYTIGHYPLQQYMVAFPGGRYQVSRQSWDSREGRWFHQYAGDTIPAGDYLHWTGNGQNWNTMCASCHSTDLKKNYDITSDTYDTQYEEVTIGCESCHGPGSRHIALATEGAYSKGSYGQIAKSAIVSSCMPCHARRSDVHPEWDHNQHLLQSFIPQIISDDFYFADGQVREEDYVYGSFVQSRMFHEGVNCMDCHSPHSGKLIAEGNALCRQCHEPAYDSPAHHFHPEGTAAAECVNCHMPERIYMGNDHRRDHSFRIPRPDQSAIYGTPNACTACHEEKTDQWAADKIVKWYGEERAYHFSDDLLPGSMREQEERLPPLIRLLEDSTQPEIARATAAHYLGEMPNELAFDALASATKSDQALIRYHAALSLGNWPFAQWSASVLPLLTDPIRAVRIAAASMVHRAGGKEQLPSSWLGAYEAASQENMDQLLLNADFSLGVLKLADHYLQANETEQAVQMYRRALDKDKTMNYARLNLSGALSRVNRPAEALVVLQEAVDIDPQNDRAHYNLGLLYYQLERPAEAIASFQNALDLNTNINGAYGNYALLLMEMEAWPETIEICERGLERFPGDEKLLYAKAVSHAALNEDQKAIQSWEQLVRLFPQNPYYLQELQSVIENRR